MTPAFSCLKTVGLTQASTGDAVHSVRKHRHAMLWGKGYQGRLPGGVSMDES